MTCTQDAAAGVVAAALAVVLAEVLSLGLPDPNYITISPGLGSDGVPAVNLQFSRVPDARRALEAWAGHFGGTVRTRPAPTDTDPREMFCDFRFAVSGVLLQAYGYFTGP